MIDLKSRLGGLTGPLYLLLFIVVSSVWILYAQNRQNFTGNVTAVEENSKGNIAHYRFDPGARTKWHSHEGGQIILVEEGVARVQAKGGPVLELHAGDTIYAKPGVAHWHGAAPGQSATQFNVSRGTTTWLDEVTEREYTAAPKR
jgi:quercetin dioxygenase-like cupin family protein